MSSTSKEFGSKWCKMVSCAALTSDEHNEATRAPNDTILFFRDRYWCHIDAGILIAVMLCTNSGRTMLICGMRSAAHAVSKRWNLSSQDRKGTWIHTLTRCKDIILCNRLLAFWWYDSQELIFITRSDTLDWLHITFLVFGPPIRHFWLFAWGGHLVTGGVKWVRVRCSWSLVFWTHHER